MYRNINQKLLFPNKSFLFKIKFSLLVAIFILKNILDFDPRLEIADLVSDLNKKIKMNAISIRFNLVVVLEKNLCFKISIV